MMYREPSRLYTGSFGESVAILTGRAKTMRGRLGFPEPLVAVQETPPPSKFGGGGKEGLVPPR